MTPIAVSAIWYGDEHWLWAVRFPDSEFDQQGSSKTFKEAMAAINAIIAEHLT